MLQNEERLVTREKLKNIFQGVAQNILGKYSFDGQRFSQYAGASKYYY